jgi:Flp pilus assembly protein TadG
MDVPRRRRRRRNTTRLPNERGQVMVLTAVGMIALCGMAALAIDVGSWFRDSRRVQLIADAAALAGAQALPNSTSQATNLANTYAATNGGSVASLSYTTKYRSNDTVTVTVTDQAPTFFSKVFGVKSVLVKATAGARTGVPGAARLVSPITVGIDNPYIACIPACYGNVVTMYLPNGGGGGGGQSANFSLVDLRPGGNGFANVNSVAGWLRDGYQGTLSLGTYKSADTSFFNSSQFGQSLSYRRASQNEIIILVHSNASGNEGPPGGATYSVVGWAAFKIQSWSGSGQSGTLTGYFTQSIVRGDPNPNPSAPDWGVRTISLIQ